MAYVNVRDWSVDQVTEWLKGLDSVITPYTKSFLNNEVKGHHLLSLRSDDLEHLGVCVIGHQEIILEAVEHLRNFHYRLDKENLQMLALKLSCAANSLYKELMLTDENCTMVPTQTMSDVHNIITSIKQLVCWLDRSPFRGDKDYVDCKTQLLQLSFEMAMSAHRDIFSEKPLRTIRNISNILTKLADHIIQDISDPMILQPASLALASLKKKKEQELGFFLVPSNYAVHQIAEIKYGSPAHNSSKIEEGDEIVQVNYQTVVGWQRKNVLLLLQESPPEIVLTLKKRPRHTKVYGQIYMKPYRLPSKKQATPYSRWNDNLPSPQLLAIYDLPQIPSSRLPIVVTQPESELEISSSSSSDSEPLDSPTEQRGRVYPLKPRPVLQRRNTITGASPTHKSPHQAIEQYWQQLKNQAAYKHSSSYNIKSDKYNEDSNLLRDKSASCNDGFQLPIRPSTVIGLSPNSKLKKNETRNSKRKKVNFEKTLTKNACDNKLSNKESFGTFSNLNEMHSVSVNSLSSLNETLDYIDEGDDIMDRSSMKIEWQREIVEEIINSINYEDFPPEKSLLQKDAALADVRVHNIIKKFDNQITSIGETSKPQVLPKNMVEKPPQLPVKPSFTKKPVVPPKNIKSGVIRGTLNKSNSAPAYDPTIEKPPDPVPIKEPIEFSVPEPIEKPFPVEYDNKPIKYELGIPIIQNDPPKTPTRLFFDLQKPKEPKYVEISDTPITKCALITASLFKRSNSTDSIIFEELPDCPDSILQSTENLSESFLDVKTTSTPTSKYAKVEFPECEAIYTKTTVKTIPMESKVSPTNSIVRAMIYSSKSKATKKKNTLVAKRRKVSVKDVAPGEMQGFLYQRSRCKQIQPVHWEKRWFVLNGNNLYGFESQDASKAKFLIFLSGFTVCVAQEVKSRSHAFKVYHTGTVFYFSSESSETTTTWIELIAAATLTNNEFKSSSETFLYSESDEDFEDEGAIKKFGSLKKSNPVKTLSTQGGSSSLDRKWFFNKANKNPLPVPTAQFRSYRKMSSSGSVTSVSTGNFTSHIPTFSPQFDSAKKESPQPTPPPTPTIKTAKKAKPLSYTHASNPNLCEVGDYQLKTFNKQFQQCNNDNLAGFVTLRELMNRQREDQKLNPYAIDYELPHDVRPDVVYGEVPIRSIKETKEEEVVENSSLQTSEGSSFCFGKRNSSKKHKKTAETYNTNTYPKVNLGEEHSSHRSLPRTHKLRDDKAKKSQSKTFAKKEFSVSYVDLKDHSAQSNTDQKNKKGKIVRQSSLTLTDKKDSGGKFFDSWKRNDKVSDKNMTKLKSAMQYTPMSLPLVPDQKGKLNPKFAFELNLDEKEKVSKSGKILNFFSGKQNERKEKHAGYNFVRDYTPTLRYEQSSCEYFHHEELKQVSEVVVPSLQHPGQVTDYPGLEYPPVFEAETYSLSDPQSSISILKKHEK